MVSCAPSLTAEWLKRVLGVMDSNHAVSGVMGGKLILPAGFIQSTLGRGLAQSFNFDTKNPAMYEGHLIDIVSLLSCAIGLVSL